MPPVNSPAIETPADGADGDQHQRRRDGLAHRAGCGKLRDQFAGMRAARASCPGNRLGAIAAMSAAFEPEMPETRYIAASST